MNARVCSSALAPPAGRPAMLPMVCGFASAGGGRDRLHVAAAGTLHVQAASSARDNLAGGMAARVAGRQRRPRRTAAIDLRTKRGRHRRFHPVSGVGCGPGSTSGRGSWSYGLLSDSCRHGNSRVARPAIGWPRGCFLKSFVPAACASGPGAEAARGRRQGEGASRHPTPGSWKTASPTGRASTPQSALCSCLEVACQPLY
jgi:hypothetical protein